MNPYDKRSKLNNGLRYSVFLLIAVMMLCLFAGCASETTPVATSVQSTPVVSEEPISVSEALPEETPVKTVERTGFSMTMLDVSQGLSLLIEADGRYMLYDGGGQSRSSYVVSYLKRQGVSELDYMVASHYDEDHISGLIGVMNTTKVDKLLSPDYTRDTHIYDSFRAKVADKGIPEEHPLRGAHYKLGTADISVLGPNQYDPGADNDNSIVLKITYGDFKCVLSGDAESEEEYSVLRNNTDIRADLYVVGHHGSADSSSKEFVQAIAPKYAFLSVGKDNAYGHPNPVTLNTLMENNVQLFRTDQQGEVTVTSDGQSVSINKPPVDITIGDPSAAADRQQVEENPTGDSHKYVLNTNPSRKRIHRPDCRSVQDIKQENFQYSDKTLEELIAEGYTPCGNCHPQ